MTPRPTPETDAAEFKCLTESITPQWMQCVKSEVARIFERQRDEAVEFLQQTWPETTDERLRHEVYIFLARLEKERQA